MQNRQNATEFKVASNFKLFYLALTFGTFFASEMLAKPSMQELLKHIALNMPEGQRGFKEVSPLLTKFIADGGDVDELINKRFMYEDEAGNVDYQKCYKWGIDPDLQFPLLFACAVGAEDELVKMLLDHGADPLVQVDGKTIPHLMWFNICYNFFMWSGCACIDLDIKLSKYIKICCDLFSRMSKQDLKNMLSKISVLSIPEVGNTDFENEYPDFDQMKVSDISPAVAYMVFENFISMILFEVPEECEQLINYYLETLSEDDQKVFAAKMQGWAQFYEFKGWYDWFAQKAASDPRDWSEQDRQDIKKCEKAYEVFKRIKIRLNGLSEIK